MSEICELIRADTDRAEMSEEILPRTRIRPDLSELIFVVIEERESSHETEEKVSTR